MFCLVFFNHYSEYKIHNDLTQRRRAARGPRLNISAASILRTKPGLLVPVSVRNQRHGLFKKEKIIKQFQAKFFRILTPLLFLSSLLLFAGTANAHTCGSAAIQVDTAINGVYWGIFADKTEVGTTYSLTSGGDASIARADRISSWTVNGNGLVSFTGMGIGTTSYTYHWDYPKTPASADCTVEITVVPQNALSTAAWQVLSAITSESPSESPGIETDYHRGAVILNYLNGTTVTTTLEMGGSFTTTTPATIVFTDTVGTLGDMDCDDENNTCYQSYLDVSGDIKVGKFDGGDWGFNTVVAKSTETFVWPIETAVISNTVYVGAVNTTPNPDEFCVYASTDGGSNWNPATPVSCHEIGNMGAPSMFMDDSSNYHVVFPATDDTLRIYNSGPIITSTIDTLSNWSHMDGTWDSTDNQAVIAYYQGGSVYRGSITGGSVATSVVGTTSAGIYTDPRIFANNGILDIIYTSGIDQTPPTVFSFTHVRVDGNSGAMETIPFPFTIPAVPAGADANFDVAVNIVDSTFPITYKIGFAGAGSVNFSEFTATGALSPGIPTLTEWGMIAMALLLAFVAVWAVRRQQINN